MGQRYVFTGVCLSIGGGVSLPTAEGLHVGGGLPTGGESASRGVCIRAGVFACGVGSLHTVGSASRGGLGRPYPELEKRVISILLECFLFEYSFHTFKYKATCLESHSSPF